MQNQVVRISEFATESEKETYDKMSFRVDVDTSVISLIFLLAVLIVLPVEGPTICIDWSRR